MTSTEFRVKCQLPNPPFVPVYMALCSSHKKDNFTAVHQTIRLVVAGGREMGLGMDWELGISQCMLVYEEWMSNKVLV